MANGGEVEDRPVGGAIGPEAGAEDAGPVAVAQAGEEGEFGAVLGDHAQVVAQADRERDVVIVEECQPLRADELPVGEKEPDCRGREVRQIAPHQRDPGLCGAVARPVEQRPEERNPEAPGDDREHEVVHVVRPDHPVGPVEHQRPGALRADHLRDERHRPVGSEVDVLEEPLQPAVGRGDQHASSRPGGDVAQVDRARADHAHHEHAERLQPRLADADMAPLHPDGAMTHGMILAMESSRRIDLAALSQPRVV
jgi:hypothetical protein